MVKCCFAFYIVDGRMARIARYEPEEKKLNFYCRTCQPIIWLGKSKMKKK